MPEEDVRDTRDGGAVMVRWTLSAPMVNDRRVVAMEYAANSRQRVPCPGSMLGSYSAPGPPRAMWQGHNKPLGAGQARGSNWTAIARLGTATAATAQGRDCRHHLRCGAVPTSDVQLARPSSHSSLLTALKPHPHDTE